MTEQTQPTATAAPQASLETTPSVTPPKTKSRTAKSKPKAKPAAKAKTKTAAKTAPSTSSVTMAPAAAMFEGLEIVRQSVSEASAVAVQMIDSQSAYWDRRLSAAEKLTAASSPEKAVDIQRDYMAKQLTAMTSDTSDIARSALKAAQASTKAWINHVTAHVPK